VIKVEKGAFRDGSRQAVDVNPERVGTGMRLTIDFERAGEQLEAVPVFRPA
jgi:hypothetical protein